MPACMCTLCNNVCKICAACHAHCHVCVQCNVCSACNVRNIPSLSYFRPLRLQFSKLKSRTTEGSYNNLSNIPLSHIRVLLRFQIYSLIKGLEFRAFFGALKCGTCHSTVGSCQPARTGLALADPLSGKNGRPGNLQKRALTCAPRPTKPYFFVGSYPRP